MCFATPGKVTKIKGKIAFIQMPHPRRSRSATLRGKPRKSHSTTLRGKHTHEVDISLLKRVKVGDYLLCHDKMAINKIPANEAKQILKFTPLSKKEK